jgi:hypothetical protein
VLKSRSWNTAATTARIAATLVVRSPRGYTGTQSRSEMLQNKEFVDVKVDLFARHGSRTWAKIGEFPIERKLLTE